MLCRRPVSSRPVSVHPMTSHPVYTHPMFTHPSASIPRSPDGVRGGGWLSYPPTHVHPSRVVSAHPMSTHLCPSIPCPSIPCPSTPHPPNGCPSIPFPSIPCPSIPCPPNPCPSIPDPSIPCPSIPFPSIPPSSGGLLGWRRGTTSVCPKSSRQGAGKETMRRTASSQGLQEGVGVEAAPCPPALHPAGARVALPPVPLCSGRAVGWGRCPCGMVSQPSLGRSLIPGGA